MELGLYNKISALFYSMPNWERAWIWPDGEFHISPDDEGSLIVRYADDKRAIACAWFTRSENLPENAYCITLFIHPDYRGLGYGEDMIRTFFQRHGEDAVIIAKIKVDNFRSKRFFEKATTVVETVANGDMVHVYCKPQSLEKRLQSLEDALLTARKEIQELQAKLFSRALQV